jgi:hypothetical protein
MTLVTIDWDLPTFEEQLHTVAPAVAEASEWQGRWQLYQEIYQLSARMEEVLKDRSVHVRDSAGNLITSWGEWWLAAVEGRWP